MKIHSLDPLPADAVIFDMDGVIADTREFHLLAFQELGERHGVPMTADQFRGMFGLENSVFLPRMFGRPMAPEESRRLADWKEARYRELITGRVELLPGVRELIAWLVAEKRPLAVASSAPRPNVEQVLRTTGIEPYFAALLSSEDVTRHKPHPDVFLTAAARLGTAPERCWVIEDSLHGIEAAKAAGIPCIAVATTHPEEELSPADVVYPHLEQFRQELCQWHARAKAV